MASPYQRCLDGPTKRKSKDTSAAAKELAFASFFENRQYGTRLLDRAWVGPPAHGSPHSSFRPLPNAQPFWHSIGHGALPRNPCTEQLEFTHRSIRHRRTACSYSSAFAGLSLSARKRMEGERNALGGAAAVIRFVDPSRVLSGEGKLGHINQTARLQLQVDGLVKCLVTLGSSPSSFSIISNVTSRQLTSPLLPKQLNSWTAAACSLHQRQTITFGRQAPSVTCMYQCSLHTTHQLLACPALA